MASFATPVDVDDEVLASIPRSYVLTMQDHSIPPALQRRMIREHPCERVIELDADHAPFFSATGELVAALLELAGASMTESYDVIVVGSGSGGAVVARRLVDAGASVCVIEAGEIGREPGDPRSRAALGALGLPRRLGVHDGSAARLQRPRRSTSRAARCSAARAA